MKQCKCEHWQECPVCQPRRFDADGNRLPPEPTPLQAARAQIEKDTALLRQALEALEEMLAAERFSNRPPETVMQAETKLDRIVKAGAQAEAIITALRERLGEKT